MIVHRCSGGTAMGFSEAKIRGNAHDHGLHKDLADVLHQPQRDHG